MARTGFFTDEKTFWHTGGMHALVMPVGGWVQPPSGAAFAESPDSKRRLLSLIQVSGLAAKLDMRSAEPVTREDMARIHPATYLDAFQQLSDTTGGDLGVTAPFGAGSFEIAALSAGLAKGAMDAVLRGEIENAYSLSRPPGHHCLPDTPMGFCLLANIPIAVEAMRARHQLGRVAIIDWDVHHGNGTQTIYYEDPDTLTISLHQDRCFPPGYSGTDERGSGKGEGANINIPLLPGGGHASYMAAMERIVVPALERFRPELIVIASGLDGSAVDPLARMQLHSESYRAMTRAMVEAAQTLCGGRLVGVHEGGYAEAYVPFCGHALVEALADESCGVEDPFLELALQWQPEPRFDALQSQIIDEIAAAHGL
ncbi:class II histone deacetylase [Aurantiacibacter rhizosphaerae]|uniref:Class II histone deacetylase n=1 Tax=Aurantiacibacter rhizosphaerae TaxID=2691582 RepID=A0A844XHK3_9SPHN|nr:class II histone deacetylase [Aurantiacibacter rhizosphaerae]MWV29044.1 class II histone deacetylase [Aurantiacibacter rhizosphaerae]